MNTCDREHGLETCGEHFSKGHDGAALERLAFAFGASQFLLHGSSVVSTHDPRMFLMHGIAFLYDIFLLAVAVVVLRTLRRCVFEERRRAVDTAAKGLLFAVGLTLASYPLLLTEFLGFPVNVFAVGLGVGGFSLTRILGSRVAMAVAAAGILGLVSLRYAFRVPLPRRRALFRILVGLCLLGIVLSSSRWTFMAIHPHPLIYSAQETIRGWIVRTARVVPQPARPVVLEQMGSPRLEPSPLEAATVSPYDHIVLLVMETVNESLFAEQFFARKDGFYSEVKDRAVYFNRYYTTNLDSYPSLIAMLTSVQVPYRAYEAPDFFSDVNKAPNMIGALGQKGWKSLFVCTSEYPAFVPIPDLWSATLHGPDLPNKEDWVSLGLNPVEAATEDKAAIPSMVSFMEAHPQTVIMHEMVFGHSPRWTMLTGKGQLEYYDELFQELYGRLNRVEKTLFIIVADHGDRTDCAVAENYHVPLLVVGEGVEPSTNDGMFSHVDLQQILGHYLFGLPLPKVREDVLVIGHSARWVYGQIATDGSSMFIDALDGIVLGQEGDLLPQDVFDRFQAEIDSFARHRKAR